LNAQLPSAGSRLAIGPRNRRRLTIAAAVGLAVTGAVVAAVLLTRSTTHSGREAGPATQHTRPSVDPRWKCVYGQSHAGGCVLMFGGVVYGMSPQQVEHRLGKPTTKQGDCWVYSQLVAGDLAAQGVVKSTVSECFFGGRLSVTSQQDYVRRNGKLVLWRPPAPKLP
jgi:hypothetical protein